MPSAAHLDDGGARGLAEGVVLQARRVGAGDALHDDKVARGVVVAGAPVGVPPARTGAIAGPSAAHAPLRVTMGRAALPSSLPGAHLVLFTHAARSASHGWSHTPPDSRLAASGGGPGGHTDEEAPAEDCSCSSLRAASFCASSAAALAAVRRWLPCCTANERALPSGAAADVTDRGCCDASADALQTPRSSAHCSTIAPRCCRSSCRILFVSASGAPLISAAASAGTAALPALSCR